MMQFNLTEQDSIDIQNDEPLEHKWNLKDIEIMQFTGLYDKSSLYEVYEGDIIDEYGNVAANIYEDSGIYAQETYYIVTPICCETWPDTYSEIIKRGCHYA